MHKPVISIRADGNAKIGLGHIYRTISLAGYLKDHFEIQFYIYQPDDLVKKLITEHRFFLITVNQKEDASEFTALLPKGSIVLLDGYNFNIEYQQKIKNDGYRLVILDDLNSETQIADVVINHGYTGNLKDYKISDHTALYTGLDYLIVKPEIISASFTDKRFGNKKILVCMGGTDPDNHSGFIVKELLIKTEKQIKLVTSVLNPKIDELKLLADQHSDRLNLYTGLNASEMISLTQLCDIAILQPSNIALESACLGIYILLFQTAENQLYIKDTLIKKQCATKLNKENLVETINSISTENINAQLKKQQQNFDRQSPARILSVFKALLIDVAKVSE
ncbi:MAG: pseudaminic acid biosynthesis-associated protein PseG [Bacteroidetes bacterium]|nr:pseudaminic acid biosynthesis-associated protein PseG [Bacteroidota bacterium]